MAGASTVSDRVLTVPNVLSTIRLLGVPLFLWAILSGRDGLALVLLMASGITDYLDGKIARKFGLESRVGQLLDPIADRLYIVSTLLGLAWREIIPWWVVWVLFAREAFMAVVVLIAKRHGWNGLPVHFVGKAATFNLLYAFPLLLLADGEGTFAHLARPVGWGFAWWGIVLYWVAGLLYAVQLRLLLAPRRVPAQ
jgi:cardiolipin synthase